ncbi:MAG: response regulator [Bacteroidota bacterium]|nr:response regulator [Bacteroidota bacterium]
MSLAKLNVLLADDDDDDCLFFKKALAGSSISTHLTTVSDGEHLMRLLKNETHELPDVLFLDLNMPRKNGFECLSEIKLDDRLKLLAVIVFSTSFEQEVVNLLYQNGAQYFLRKPSEISHYKEIIQQTLLMITQATTAQPARENFVITRQSP